MNDPGLRIVGTGAMGGYEGNLIRRITEYAGRRVQRTRGESFEVIHAHDWVTLPAGLAIAARTGRPLVVHVHSTEFDRSGEGEMRHTLEARVRQLGLSQAVRFLGVRGGDELIRLFQLAEVVCVPSRNEPFGIVVLEAWSARKPVVVTQNGGPDEFVEHEYSGLKIQPQPNSIAWGLGTMFMNFDRARWMGQNGRREVEARFSWDTICGQTLCVYGAALPREEAEQLARPAEQEALPVAAGADPSGQKAPSVEPQPWAAGELADAAGPMEEPAVAAASLPATELAGLRAAETSSREEASLQIQMSAKLSWKPRSVGHSVTDVLASCKRVLAESGLHVLFHGRAAKVEGPWSQVLEAVNRCFRLADRTGQSQIVATIMPPTAPLGSPNDLDETILIPDKTPAERMMVKDLVAVA